MMHDNMAIFSLCVSVCVCLSLSLCLCLSLSVSLSLLYISFELWVMYVVKMQKWFSSTHLVYFQTAMPSSGAQYGRETLLRTVIHAQLEM